MPVGHVLEHILQFDSCQDSANGNADQLSVLVMHKSVLEKVSRVCGGLAGISQ